MHSNMPRLSDAQSGSGALHSAQRSFPGICLRIAETLSDLLAFTSSSRLQWLLSDGTSLVLKGSFPSICFALGRNCKDANNSYEQEFQLLYSQFNVIQKKTESEREREREKYWRDSTCCNKSEFKRDAITPVILLVQSILSASVSA